MTALATRAADPEARWAQVFAHIVGVEGSRFTDDPADRGGATRYGVSLRFLASECRLDPKLIAEMKIGHDGGVTVDDIRGLSLGQANVVYRQCFWEETGVAYLPLHLDSATFDQAVNDGLVPAVELLQRALNAVAPAGAARLPVDGVLGTATQRRAQLAGQARPVETRSAMRTFAAARYRGLVAADPSQRKYLDGWLTRADHLGDI